MKGKGSERREEEEQATNNNNTAVGGQRCEEGGEAEGDKRVQGWVTALGSFS